jgi:hypothetical protein
MWNSAQPIGQPDVSRDFDSPVEAAYVDGTFTATIPLVDASGDPAGTGTVNATLTPVGEQFTIDDSFRFGNVRERFSALVQPLAAEGTAVIDGRTFDLSVCFAEDTSVTTFRTNPNSFVERFGTADTNCIVENADGTIAGVFIDAGSDDVFVDAFLFEGPGSPAAANGVVSLSNGTGSGQLEMFDPETGDPTGGTASIDLGLTASDDFYTYVLHDGAGKQMVRGHLVDVEGTLTFPGLPSFDLTECIAFTGEAKDIFHAPRGPKPTGKAPANDLPAGALRLDVGGKTSQSTRAAVLDQEAGYSCMVFEDPFSGTEVIPVEHTVWFKVTGTGGAVTVDTAGSDFDSVAAAYVRDGGGAFVELACVDDVPLDPIGRTLQAAVTFPTTAGTTYYVQVGGFPGFQSYGNLRVAVR